MYREDYRKKIESIQNSMTVSIIGKIDVDEVLKNDVDSLFYVFPLIERIVLEICKFYPELDVEKHTQGEMRTMKSLLSLNIDEILSIEVKESLDKYYNEHGLRNKLFHVTNEDLVVDKEDIKEIDDLLLKVLEILYDNCCNIDKSQIDYIEYIK